ncbi:MAG: M48 family metallopeptidase [Clostridium sp.]|nr:M48 family metallopeptidase [Clostridium sp.]
MKKFMDLGMEQLYFGLNKASKIKLSPTQLPEIYNILPPICEQLEIEEPEFYLEMNPAPNAYAFGDTQTAITVTSSLVEMMSPEELRAIVAHECGHIACHHMLYHSLAQVLANASGLFETLCTLATPIHYALMYWQRKSELSCDRAAAFVTSPETVMAVMARLAGGPKSITSRVNMKEWAQQADEYEKIYNGGLWNKTLQRFAVLDQDHPFHAVRVREILKWKESGLYRRAMENNPICPYCHRPIEHSWRFCQHCGHKLP